MAQLLKINTITYKENVNELGDVVGVFDDNHIFDDNELAMFDVEKVDGTQEHVQSMMRLAIPEIKTVYQSKTAEWTDVQTDTQADEKSVWQDGEQWKELVACPKYLTKYTGKFEHNLYRSVNNIVPISIEDK